MRICELHDKEVVNVKDGCILGCVVDIDFDCKTGCICALFGRDIEYIIPYKCVMNIGEDAILVDVVLEKVSFRCT